MTDLDLKRLEARVDELIHTVKLLNDENKGLRSRHSELMTERAQLLEKTELAKTRVEAMITRLKSMEDGS